MNQKNTWLKFMSLVVIQQLNLIIMIAIPVFWLTDFVTLNIQTISIQTTEEHILDAFP